MNYDIDVTKMKIVYSGDCRPSQALITAGMNCDLLLHEATFNDTMSNDAECKRHCTTSEAVNVGLRMHAKYTVLTHFSQRYPTAVQSCSYPPPLPPVPANCTPVPPAVQKYQPQNLPQNQKNQKNHINYDMKINENMIKIENGSNKTDNSKNLSLINRNNKPFSVAFDLLQFSFPSQVNLYV
jgi:ribonuclease BN (tRNA processing enzyme)